MYTKLAYNALNETNTIANEEIKQAMRDMRFNISESYLPCHIVRVIDEWSSTHIMMQQKANGNNLKDWLQNNENNKPTFKQKSKVFKSLIVWWAYLAFKKHIVHSDPHYGNIMVYCNQNNGNVEYITFIDWGCLCLCLLYI